MLRNQKGITLVALVVTIIVLLILAGVSISMVAGDNGIATRASEASEDTKIGNAKSALELAVSTAQTNYYAVYADDDDTTTPVRVDASVVNGLMADEGFTLTVESEPTAGTAKEDVAGTVTGDGITVNVKLNYDKNLGISKVTY